MVRMRYWRSKIVIGDVFGESLEERGLEGGLEARMSSTPPPCLLNFRCRISRSGSNSGKTPSRVQLDLGVLASPGSAFGKHFGRATVTGERDASGHAGVEHPRDVLDAFENAAGERA